NRARAHAHGPRQTPLGLARFLQPPLDHRNFQHGRHSCRFPRKEYDSEFQKSSLTFSSEYQKLRLSWRRCPIRSSARASRHIQLSIWEAEHSDALRDCLSRGMSYGEAADAINARFGTGFTRNAAVGRAKRLGLKVGLRLKKPRGRPRSVPKRSRKAARPEASATPAPPPGRVATVKLRCVGIRPRLLAFADLEPLHCRYPYGGAA